MNRTLLLSLQIGVAVAMIAVWHVLTTTTLIGDPDKLQFFFSTPADVARQIWAWFMGAGYSVPQRTFNPLVG